MNLLAFDSSTETLSVALTRPLAGSARLWAWRGIGGAQASTTLLPQILAMLGEAKLQLRQLDAIAFGQGPGSFTGLRTACAVAQGLGFGAGVSVLPVDNLLAVAEEARFQQAADDDAFDVQALLDARMDEVYAARYCWTTGHWRCDSPHQLLAPQHVAAAPLRAGNVFAAYGDRLPGAGHTTCIEALPSATAMLRLAPALLAAGLAVSPEQAWPLYIRDKVAQTTAERVEKMK